jgi:DnaJ-class molecular chaperone
MNLPKYASQIELKKQYHKFAKICHPDVINKTNSQHSEKSIKK